MNTLLNLTLDFNSCRSNKSSDQLTAWQMLMKCGALEKKSWILRSKCIRTIHVNIRKICYLTVYRKTCRIGMIQYVKLIQVLKRSGATEMNAVPQKMPILLKIQHMIVKWILALGMKDYAMKRLRPSYEH